jgi:hypothetical protein
MLAHRKQIRSAVFTSITALAQGQHLTAREVVARIQQRVGVPWQSDTVDTFKAGNPDSPVSGIAVTMMATLDVLQRAKRRLGIGVVRVVGDPAYVSPN